MKILVMNCGSSSLKYQLIDMENESVLAKGLCERIGIEGSLLAHTPAGGEKYKLEVAMPTHKEAIELVMKALVDPDHGVIQSTDEISAIGHRVVHGGTYYSASVLVDENVKKAIADCFDLAPLHNPANLMGIEACEAAMPGKPNVAVFDTAFGMSMQEKAYLYALPYEYYEKYKVRRYGFHGTSHNFVAGEVIRKGMTPLEGLIMGTRSGDIDPAIIQFICEHEKLTVEEMTDVLNKKSGVLGLSNGISSDFRDIDDAANDGNKLARVALDAFTLRVAKYVGAYITEMNGVDAIAFTAGVGENDKFMRKNICAYLEYLGVEIDDEINNVRGEERMA